MKNQFDIWEREIALAVGLAFGYQHCLRGLIAPLNKPHRRVFYPPALLINNRTGDSYQLGQSSPGGHAD